MNWYALYVRSRWEKKVEQTLRRREIEVFLPVMIAVRQWSDRKKRVEVPLFSGYVFVRVDLKDKLKVLQTDGVVRFVGVEGRPSAIPDYQIDDLRKVVVCPETLEHEKQGRVGERVRVSGGAFAGVRGTITRRAGRTRVVITIEAIGKSISFEVPEQLVQLQAQAESGQ